MLFLSVNKMQIPANFIRLLSALILLFFGVKLNAQTTFVKNDNANPLQRFAVASSRQSHPVFTDIDNDGDLDCFSGEFNYSQTGVVSSRIVFFKNNGDAEHPLFTEVKKEENPLANVAIAGAVIPQFVDIDGDGDEDCFIANNNGAISFYKNMGTAGKALFVKQSAAFNPLSGVKFSSLEISQFLLSDVDGDGDADCLITDKEGNETYLINIGSASKPAFVDNTNNPFSIIKNTSFQTLSLYDWNGDRRPDLFADKTAFQNIAGRFIKLVAAPSFDNDNASAMCWVDLNKDGVPELVNGTTDGRFTYCTVSSADTKSIATITVSPNPTTKFFTLSLTLSKESRILKVVNAEGKTMLSQTITSNHFTFGESLGKGTYFIQIISSGKAVAESKIIKL